MASIASVLCSQPTNGHAFSLNGQYVVRNRRHCLSVTPSPKFSTSTRFKKRHRFNGTETSLIRLWSRRASLEGVVVTEGKRERVKKKKILLSDVEVKETRPLIFGKDWDFSDMASASVILALHACCVFAPFTFTWSAFGVFLGLYFVTGLLGITLSYHRHLSHKSFKIPKWLEYFFAYCGAQAFQGSPIDWVSTHRYHHQHCDSEKDPHSPVKGFWYSHMNWLFDRRHMLDNVGSRSNVADLERQFFYKFIDKTYVIHQLGMGLILYALGGIPFLVWGMVKQQGISSFCLSLMKISYMKFLYTYCSS
eukprot:TRINITY_DN4883_c0_g1_i2.p1 TRINITY_DN4883_c0_g1~~TRINITY_DN4883_c0_g1_i2.p1  ORF type:complete len:307 (+),score=32.29 TRINITY_DN4883_c0_g1_i2:200-1120(+)